MDAILKARELGKAIQADERYQAYQKAKTKNDADDDLQNKIGDFNLLRQNLQLEMSKPDGEKSEIKISEINEKLQKVYGDIMNNVNMADFTMRKNALDGMLREINQIIALCCDGDDPDTCQPQNNASCGGSCSTCGGCG